MANRNPSTALIRGEATARRNFDNAPGMYSGINKVIKAGSNLMKEAGDQGMKKRVEKEKQSKLFDITSSEVMNKLGGLQTTADQEKSKAKIEQAKQMFLAGDEAKSMEMFNKESQYIDKLLDSRINFASNMSSATSPEEQAIYTAFLKEEYTRDDSGDEPVYTSTRDGVEFSMTLSELQESFVPQAPQYAEAYQAVWNAEHNTANFSEETVKGKVNQAMPKKGDIKGLRAFISDDIRSGQNFEAMLETDSSLKQEINQALMEDPRFNYDDDKGSISDEEFSMFKKAIVDPFAEDVNGNQIFETPNQWENFSRQIVLERLVRGIQNENKNLYPDNYKVEENTSEVENNGEFDNLINQN